jgi:hypothetical protein
VISEVTPIGLFNPGAVRHGSCRTGVARTKCFENVVQRLDLLLADLMIGFLPRGAGRSGTLFLARG